MFENYLKMSWKVLLRRPFFTFISLIGISFTLMILTVGVAFYENSYAPTGMMKNFDRVISISHFKQYNTDNTGFNDGPLGICLINKYIKTLKKPSRISLSSSVRLTKIFKDKLKLESNLRYTDAQFWDIASFEFMKGRPFNEAEVKNGSRVVVVDEKTCLEFFGTIDVIGKEIEISDLKYKVAGVIENVPSIRNLVFANIFLPYTSGKINLTDENYLGSYSCLLLANKKDDIEEIKAEWKNMVSRLTLPKQFSKAESETNTLFDCLINNYTSSDTSHTTFIAALVLLLLLFLLLPSLNLVNLNITRIMERSAEIGVRKSYGASSQTLVVQFIVENIFLTLIGGVIGLILSFIVLKIISLSDFLPGIHFSINAMVVIYSIISSLFFGLLSGAYPAWKMSKLNIMKALKEEKI